MKKLILIFALACTGCTTLDRNYSTGSMLDESKPVETKVGLFTFPIKQDGKRVNFEPAFEKHDETRALLHSAENYRVAAPALLGASILVPVGMRAINQDSKSLSIASIVVGVGLLGSSVYMSYLRNEKLAEAGDIYNRKFTEKSKGESRIDWRPFLFPLQAGGGLGLLMEF